MRTLCHCSEPATVSVQGLMICPKCEDFLARHPALELTLINQWRAMRAETPAEPAPEAKA